VTSNPDPECDPAVVDRRHLHSGAKMAMLDRRHAPDKRKFGRYRWDPGDRNPVPPELTPTAPSMRGITSRVLDVSGRAGVIGDVFRLYTFGQREQGEFQWLTIGKDIPVPSAEVFDPVWSTQPP
jgi:hypothetical protein